MNLSIGFSFQKQLPAVAGKRVDDSNEMSQTIKKWDMKPKNDFRDNSLCHVICFTLYMQT